LSGGAVARAALARVRLVRELARLADAASASALERCPYRDRGDACTFAHGCRNQRRNPGQPVHCAGMPLDGRPA
jgi:hypothetical protein